MPLVGFLRSTSLANATPRERIPEVLRQLVPKATTIVVLVPPNTTETEAERRDVQVATQALGQQLTVLDATSERDIEPAFATFIQLGPVRCSSAPVRS